jgi:hypothetical protein
MLAPFLRWVGRHRRASNMCASRGASMHRPSKHGAVRTVDGRLRRRRSHIHAKRRDARLLEVGWEGAKLVQPVRRCAAAQAMNRVYRVLLIPPTTSGTNNPYDVRS